MVLGKSFTFNGKNSWDDFNLIIVDFDSSSGFEEPDTVQKLELTTERMGNNPKNVLINVKYENSLSFKIGICKSHCKNDDIEFTQTEVRNIHKWLISDEYLKLTIDSPKFEGVFFNAIPINITPEIINDKIVGFVIEWQCDSPFGYETITNTYTIENNEMTILFDNTTDDLLNSGIIRPQITVKKSGTGEWYINNKTTNRIMKFTQILNDETLHMDCENYVLVSDVKNHNLYNYFNRVWVEFISGINEIEIFGNGIITISCDFPRKVGI